MTRHECRSASQWQARGARSLPRSLWFNEASASKKVASAGTSISRGGVSVQCITKPGLDFLHTRLVQSEFRTLGEMNIDKALIAGTGRDSDSDTPMGLATEEPAALSLQLPVRFHHLCHLSEPPEKNHMLFQLLYQPWSLACVQERSHKDEDDYGHGRDETGVLRAMFGMDTRF